MKKRRWSNEAKLGIVLAGLQGQSVSLICQENGISQSLYYKWRDQFMANASRAFDSDKAPTKQMKLEAENSKLKRLVGELHLELKKTEEWL